MNLFLQYILTNSMEANKIYTMNMIGGFKFPLVTVVVVGSLTIFRLVLTHNIKQLMTSSRKILPKRTRFNIQLSISSMQTKVTVMFTRLNRKK